MFQPRLFRRQPPQPLFLFTTMRSVDFLPKRLLSWRFVLLNIPILILFATIVHIFLRPTALLPHTQAPPRLARLAAHHPRPRTLPDDRAEWKRPKVLTAHAIRTNDKRTLDLAIFTTGTDTQVYGRKFHVIACMVGNLVYTPTSTYPEVTICEVEPPTTGDAITILLRLDDQLRLAMNESFESFHQVFEMLPGDVTPLENVTVPGESAVAAIASQLRWNDDLIDIVDETLPRHELCLMHAMKQYPYLLDGFVEYYRRMGVDQIFIYDQFSHVDIAAQMAKFNFVQVVFWPFTRSQEQSFTHFMRASRSRCKYVAYFDADEYIMVGDDRSHDHEAGIYGRGLLRRYVQHRMRTNSYQQIVTHFLRFLNNGYVRRPSGALPELYTRREKDQKVKIGKAIIDTDYDFVFHKVHLVEGRGTSTYWNMTMELDPKSLAHNAMLMHYTDRSWEENVLKLEHGGPTAKMKDSKPKKLDMNIPSKDYMDKRRTVSFDGFVKRYRNVMKIPLPIHEMLVWREGQAWCRKEWCPSCWWNKMSDSVCSVLQ